MSEQSSVKETLEKALQDGLKALKEALDLPTLETLRNTYLSKKGIFTAHMQALATAGAEERPQLGKIINDAKTRFQQALQERSRHSKHRKWQRSWRRNGWMLPSPGGSKCSKAVCIL